MFKVLKLSAEEILKINIDDPEKLFSRNDFDAEFDKLRLKWHPDRNANSLAKDVFIRIMELVESAKGKIQTDTWNGCSSVKFTIKSGKTYRFSYAKFRPFELGKMYISSKYIAYVVDGENKDLFDNAVKAIKGMKYPQAKFKQEFKKLMPEIVQAEESDIGYVMVLKKPKGAILLEDLIDFLPNQTLPPKHTAWVVSSMYNIAMFLDHIGITHNSILASTVFVNPKEHTCYLLGGWWYSAKTDTKLKAIPSELTRVLPKELFDDNIANTCYDRQSIKAMAVKCLGDLSLIGSKLLFDKDLPKPMVNWVRSTSKGSAFDEYKGWDEALKSSYGKRKFTKFTVDISQLYL